MISFIILINKMKVNLSLIIMFKVNKDAVNTFVSSSSNIISIPSDKSITIFENKKTI